MTSNQVAYWKQQEEARHNREDERYKHKQNQLKAEENRIKREEVLGNLSIKERALLQSLIQQMDDMGIVSFNALPKGAQQQFADLLGIDISEINDDSDAMRNISSIWDEIKNTLSSLGGGKGIGAMFFGK